MAVRPYYIDQGGNCFIVNAVSAHAALAHARSQEEFSVRQATQTEVDWYKGMSGCDIETADDAETVKQVAERNGLNDEATYLAMLAVFVDREYPDSLSEFDEFLRRWNQIDAEEMGDD